MSRALARHPGIRGTLVHTGQHFDPEMSETLLRELELPERAYDLGIHGGGQSVMTGRLMEALDPIFRNME